LKLARAWNLSNLASWKKMPGSLEIEKITTHLFESSTLTKKDWKKTHILRPFAGPSHISYVCRFAFWCKKLCPTATLRLGSWHRKCCLAVVMKAKKIHHNELGERLTESSAKSQKKRRRNTRA
jgi:hypothetical protein